MSPEMQTVWNFINTLLIAFLTAALPIAIKLVVDYLTLLRTQVQSRLSKEQQYMIEWVIENSVAAAEQSGLAKLIEDTAKAKKEYALATADAFLKSKDIHLDIRAIEALIEAEVYRQLTLPKQEETQPVGFRTSSS